jgi:hypothetical protein
MPKKYPDEFRADVVAIDAAYAANPARSAGSPTPPKLPTVAWINEPLEPTNLHRGSRDLVSHPT